MLALALVPTPLEPAPRDVGMSSKWYCATLLYNNKGGMIKPKCASFEVIT